MHPNPDNKPLLSTLLLFILVVTTNARAEPESVALIPFGDDLQSERQAMMNDEFAAAYPAGPLVTRALAGVLSQRGLTASPDSSAEMELSGTVTTAYMMSKGMPTNTVGARYRLVERGSGRVIAEGHAEGNDWNNPDAAKRLAEAIVKAALR
jgi:hypothetical protein